MQNWSNLKIKITVDDQCILIPILISFTNMSLKK